MELGLPLQKPATLRDAGIQEALSAVGADVMVVVAYGLILPAAVLSIPPRGCLNIHASLLPRWRGAAPIQRAIEAGDAETGISIMQMDAGLDTGPVLLERRLDIRPDETAGTLFDRLAHLGAATITEALERLPELVPKIQPATGITYAAKITKGEARIDWNTSAEVLERKIRALDPFPGCDTEYAGLRFKVWQSAVSAGHAGARPGTILDATSEGILVQCADGALLLTQLQIPGGRRATSAEILRRLNLPVGGLLT
jgi:methionyl-tRNA formyltransferase